MTIYCDKCQQTNKGHYTTFMVDGIVFTLCDDCRWGPRVLKSPNEKFNELQTPFWKLMGAKPKPKDIALEKYLKHRGMTYGDYRRERDALYAKNPSALPAFERHYKQYGPNSAPDPSFNKGR